MRLERAAKARYITLSPWVSPGSSTLSPHSWLTLSVQVIVKTTWLGRTLVCRPAPCPHSPPCLFAVEEREAEEEEEEEE